MFGGNRVTALAAVGMSIVIALTGCGADKKTQIDTTDGITNILDYVTVDFDGKNGEGTAFVNVDYDGMETEMVGGKEKIEALDEFGDRYFRYTVDIAAGDGARSQLSVCYGCSKRKFREIHLSY